ncbi:glutathione S-transferase family protein [Marinobacter sp. LN3S78]|uniref:glutathione S-transferase family protein n=1 Tax=Marinobacter sp. LN3S78 TaxID=3382300 RepID=UPI00387B4C25
MIPEFELITHVLCPYVQRSVIALQEKRIPYRRTDIDLSNKPDWFQQISPLGKVPVLVAEGKGALFESAVICEYLDEVTPGTLHPEDPWRRADHRAWIEFGSGILTEIARMYSGATREAFDKACDTLRVRFRQLDERLDNGPWFAGETFCLIDAVYGPIFRYFDVFDTALDLDIFQNVEKVQLWRGHLRTRESVRQAVTADYPERLLAFVGNRGSYMSSLVAGANHETSNSG